MRLGETRIPVQELAKEKPGPVAMAHSPDGGGEMEQDLHVLGPCDIGAREMCGGLLDPVELQERLSQQELRRLGERVEPQRCLRPVGNAGPVILTGKEVRLVQRLHHP